MASYLRSGRSSVTFLGAFQSAKTLGVTQNMTIYALFITGLMKVRLHSLSRFHAKTKIPQLPVQVRSTAGSSDYKLDQIPTGVLGQAYVVLSKSNKEFSDKNVIAGPAILEARVHSFEP